MFCPDCGKETPTGRRYCVYCGTGLGDALTPPEATGPGSSISDAETRSGGGGTAMLDWLADYARQHNCAMLDLDSGVQRGRAHRFYFTRGMQISSYHFRMGLD